jgi:hypothetical protein
MSDTPDFRIWATRVTQQANNERDAREAQRLMSIAGYWKRLADVEDWQRDASQASEGKPHQRAS